MNFQALHFSSEEDSDDSSVDSYESSDEEGGMVGGAFSMFGKKTYPETESFLKKLFYYSHMNGDDVVFEIKSNMDDDTVDELIKERNQITMLMKFVGTQKKQREYKQEQEKIQKQILTKKMEKVDIRVLHYIDVLMQISTCDKKNASRFMISRKLPKETLKWLYNEYINTKDNDDERKQFYENVLFHNASFNEKKNFDINLFNSMNNYYFLSFSCDSEDKVRPIKRSFKKIGKQLNNNDDKLKKIVGITSQSEKEQLHLRNKLWKDYIENIKRDIDPYDIKLNDDSSTKNIRETISNFLNDKYITNNTIDNTIDNFEIYDNFWKQKDNQYENIALSANDVPNKYPFLIRNKRNHTFPRFNIVFHKDSYAENVKKWFELCHTYEFTPIYAENTMGLTEQYYNGLNVTFAYGYEKYYQFEIRFHTLETFMLKEIPNYHIKGLVELFPDYNFEYKYLQRRWSITSESIQLKRSFEVFEKLKKDFRHTPYHKSKQNEDKPPIDFIHLITDDDKQLTEHRCKTILYFLIANQSEEDLKIFLRKKKKRSDFDKFKDIYQELNDDSMNDDNDLYDGILTYGFGHYLKFLKDNLYTSKITRIVTNKLIPKGIKISENITRFIQDHDIYSLKSQLQKICNNNMILKHFIPKYSGISFEIKDIAPPPQEEPFNPFPESLGYELIVNEYMKFVMNSESMETMPLSGVEESKESEPEQQPEQPDNEEEEEVEQQNPNEGEGSEMKSDESQHTDKSKPPEKEYDVYFQHVNERVYQLDKLLEDATKKDTDFEVTIAGDANGDKIFLGTGLAKTQWIEQGYTNEQYRQFMDHLHQSLKGLKNKYDDRVVYGRVSGREASATHYHVWGANTTHMKLKNGQPIDGAGQAEDMKTMDPGVFGIVTTPVRGKPNLEDGNEESIKYYADITAGLKELLAKPNEPHLEMIVANETPGVVDNSVQGKIRRIKEHAGPLPIPQEQALHQSTLNPLAES